MYKSKVTFWIVIIFYLFLFNNNTVFSNVISINSELLSSSTNKELEVVKKLLKEGNTKEALENLYSLLNNAHKRKDFPLVLKLNELLADIYRDNGDYLKSNVYLNKALEVVGGDKIGMQIIYFKKGGNFQNDGEIDSALINYEKSIFIGDQLENKYDLKAKVHANISGIYYLKANYPKAIEHSKTAIEYQRILGNKEIEAGILNNLGGIYYMTGNYKEALKTFESALSLVGFGQEELQKKTRNMSYINMAYAYSGLNNFEKAFEFQDKYFSLNDSLSQELKYKEIAEIESKFKVESKAKEAEIEKVKRQEAEYLAYSLGLAILFLLAGIYVLYKVIILRKRNYSLQIEQEKLVHQSKVEKIKGDLQLKILAATLDGRLEERKKIASVLHDNISALLSAANLHLYASKKQLKGNVPLEIEKSQSILNEASEQIRDLSHDLISAVLLKFGIGIATQDLCEKSSNSTLEIECDFKNITRFDQNFEIKIFNIINELVNNILKHSKATKGLIKIEQIEGNLQVVVSDDGVGFEVDDIQQKGGIGFNQIEARINVLDGLIKINSSNEGTRIFISVPIVY